MLTLNGTNYALDVTLCGVVIVFSMLVLLVIIISVFGKIMGTINNQTVKEKKPAIKNTVATKPAATSSEIYDEELIAVITAAVSTIYEGTGKRPIIKAVKPVSGRNSWALAGLIQNTKSFY